MRLRSLRLQAFGPYAAEQVIDFERLSGSGLFLLEGPTGAGKTTILDAVTFALYGGLAGQSASDDRLQSHFADPSVEPSVTCEFSLRGVTYRVMRVPEHLRPKKRGEGFVTEASRVHLQRLADGGWVSLSSNKAEAGSLITEAVGLNRDQFTQVMLLPQGEFARFLRCGDDERREVLTKLFGTGLYDRITTELDRRRAEAARAREQSDRRIAAAVSAAAEAAGLDEAARADLLALPPFDRRVRFKETADGLAAAEATAAETLTQAQRRLTAATAAQEQAKRNAELMSRLTQARARLADHEATRPGYERDVARLTAARQAEPVRPLLERLAEAEEAVAGQRQAAASLIGPAGLAPESGSQDAAGWPESFPDPAPERVEELARDATARGDAAERDAAGLQHLVDIEAGLPGQRAALVAMEQAAKAASAKVAALEEARSGLPGLIDQLAGEWQQARAQAAGLETAQVKLAAVERQREAAARAAEVGVQTQTARAAMQAAVDEHQARVDEHQALNEARLAGIAAELAATLAEGEPCPVCGATAHPTPATPRGAQVSPEDVADAASRRDEAEAERRAREAEHAQLAQEEAAARAVSQGRDPAELSAEASELAEAIMAAQQAAEEAARCETELAARRAELESSADDLREAGQRAAAASAEAAAARSALDTLTGRLAEAAGDQPSVAARQAALRDAAARDRAAAGVLDRYAAGLVDGAKAREQAEREAVSGGFASLAAAGEAVLAPADQDHLAAAVEAWSASLAALTAAVEAEDLAGLDPDQAESVRAGALAAAEELTAAQQADKAARSGHDAAATRAQRFTQLLEEVRRHEDDHDRLVESTEPVIRLAGLAKGMDGHRRVALTTYVLRHWFAQVVAAANVRLSAMSSGRYELKRTDKGENRRDRAGLTLAVVDRHTGEERSPGSLSGGETFYTSLALALGLADVVKAEAGGVDLDTLFIDEGFGSLDAETLDQVMAVIDDLRDRGRVVGIVSHVADLKDRVPERLEVRRLPDGSSTVRVVA